MKDLMEHWVALAIEAIGAIIMVAIMSNMFSGEKSGVGIIVWNFVHRVFY